MFNDRVLGLCFQTYGESNSHMGKHDSLSRFGLASQKS